MNALKYTLAVTAFLLIVVACATPPEDDPVAEIPDELPQLRAQAQELQSTIARYELDEYEGDEFALGVAAYERGEALLDENPQDAVEGYERAIGHFEVVIERGFGALLVDRQSEVEGKRQQAVEARAPSAATSEFEQAEEVLAQAIELREAGSYEESYASFEDAGERFDASRRTADRRRDEARAALDQLDERFRETEDRASELERELEEEERALEEGEEE